MRGDLMMDKDNNIETEQISQDNLCDNNEENIEEILKTKDKDIEELNNQLLRLQADFVNFRKRTEKEKESTVIYALESFICNLLPVIDNFQRAIESEEEHENSFFKGVEMIYQQLIKVFEDNGVKEIKSQGEEFDPNLHHAVFAEESSEFDSGKVIEVLQKGYMLKDKVIRPSMVKVAK